MNNNSLAHKTYVRFVVACILVLGILSILCGTFLVWKGYQAGELLISGGGVGAISGLLGMVGPRPTPSLPPPPTPDEPKSPNNATV